MFLYRNFQQFFSGMELFFICLMTTSLLTLFLCCIFLTCSLHARFTKYFVEKLLIDRTLNPLFSRKQVLSKALELVGGAPAVTLVAIIHTRLTTRFYETSHM